MKPLFKSILFKDPLMYIFLFIPLIYAENTMRKQNIQEIDLSGVWQFQIDSLDIGTSEKWFSKRLSETVNLPGSMAENGKGDDVSVRTKWTGQVVDKSWYTDDKYSRYREKGNIKIPFWLQPVKHYVGVAWYRKEIEIPENWKDNFIELLLERCHWESTIWVDNQKIGMQNSLATAHIYNLSGVMSPGKHVITIRIDNRIKEIDPGLNSHSVSDHTQTNWNGIVGNIMVMAQGDVTFDKVRIFPDILNKQVLVKLRLKTLSKNLGNCTLKLSVGNADTKLNSLIKEVKVENNQELEIVYPMGDTPLLWDEFQPNVYTMHLELENETGYTSKKINFGMREFKTEGTNFIINGRPVFLRGTLECAIFPKTGYPSTDVEEWKRIFNTIKAHGLNHMRFHSWCPPEAAFAAADRVGIYLQVECSSWANGSSSLGDGKPIDKWLYEEAESILDAIRKSPFVLYDGLW